MGVLKNFLARKFNHDEGDGVDWDKQKQKLRESFFDTIQKIDEKRKELDKVVKDIANSEDFKVFSTGAIALGAAAAATGAVLVIGGNEKVDKTSDNTTNYNLVGGAIGNDYKVLNEIKNAKDITFHDLVPNVGVVVGDNVCKYTLDGLTWNDVDAGGLSSGVPKLKYVAAGGNISFLCVDVDNIVYSVLFEYNKKYYDYGRVVEDSISRVKLEKVGAIGVTPGGDDLSELYTQFTVNGMKHINGLTIIYGKNDSPVSGVPLCGMAIYDSKYDSKYDLCCIHPNYVNQVLRRNNTQSLDIKNIKCISATTDPNKLHVLYGLGPITLNAFIELYNQETNPISITTVSPYASYPMARTLLDDDIYKSVWLNTPSKNACVLVGDNKFMVYIRDMNGIFRKHVINTRFSNIDDIAIYGSNLLMASTDGLLYVPVDSLLRGGDIDQMGLDTSIRVNALSMSFNYIFMAANDGIVGRNIEVNDTDVELHILKNWSGQSVVHMSQLAFVCIDMSSGNKLTIVHPTEVWNPKGKNPSEVYIQYYDTLGIIYPHMKKYARSNELARNLYPNNAYSEKSMDGYMKWCDTAFGENNGSILKVKLPPGYVVIRPLILQTRQNDHPDRNPQVMDIKITSTDGSERSWRGTPVFNANDFGGYMTRFKSDKLQMGFSDEYFMLQDIMRHLWKRDDFN